MFPAAVYVHTKPVFTSSIAFISPFIQSPYLLLLENKMWIYHAFPCPFFRKQGEDKSVYRTIFEQVVCLIY